MSSGELKGTLYVKVHTAMSAIWKVFHKSIFDLGEGVTFELKAWVSFFDFRRRALNLNIELIGPWKRKLKLYLRSFTIDCFKNQDYLII